MKSYIIYKTTIQVNARNDIAVDRGGYDRSTKTTPYRNNGKVDRQGDKFIVLLVGLQKLTRADMYCQS
jgi:hypothetical protein